MGASKKRPVRGRAAKAKPRAAPKAKAKAKADAKPKAKAKAALRAKPLSKGKPKAVVKAEPKSKPRVRGVAKAHARTPSQPAPKPKAGFGAERPTLVSGSPDAKAKPKKQEVTTAGGITSDAVQRRTGKSWDQWFAILDTAGARDLDHKGIVAILAQRHGVGPWWQQMVTVAYEQIRGKREKHETETGYAVSSSRTMNVPLARLFRMWNDAEQRARWLSDERFQIKKASSGKSIRAHWGRGSSRVDVYFQDRGTDKSAVNVQHNQIENRDAAEQMKAYWQKKLEALEKALG